VPNSRSQPQSKELRRQTTWFAALAVGAYLGLSVAGAEAPAPQGVYSDESAYGDLLQKGVDLAKAKRSQEAIDNYFDKVIGFYSGKYAKAKPQMFCSHSSSETLLYTLNGAANGKDALVVGPLWCDALYDKAYALINLNRLNEAEDALNRALALAPENAKYLNELGHILSLRKQWPKAIATFSRAEEAAKYAPSQDATAFASRACRGVGYALTEQRRLDESETNYHRCLSIDAADQQSLIELQYIKKLRKSP
jgi:tetratricopeptide (TPR) repeat protein